MSDLKIDDAHVEDLIADSIDVKTLNSTVLTVNTLRVDEIVSRLPFIEINCTKNSNHPVEISQTDISDADFFKILRSKIRLTIDKDDPMYLSALGKMVVE